jgi:hypothetical protein
MEASGLIGLTAAAPVHRHDAVSVQEPANSFIF